MMNIVEAESPKICVISSFIPPDYSGAGKRAYRHCLYLKNNGMLAYLVTQTVTGLDNKNSSKLLEENEIFRLPAIWQKDMRYKSTVQKITETVFYNWKLFFFLFKNRNQFEIIHVFSGDGLGTVFFSKLFKKPIVKEFTIMPDIKRKSAHWSQKYTRNFLFNKSTVVVCVSDALEKWCKDNKIKTKTQIIYNETLFSPRTEKKIIIRHRHLRENLSNKQPIILFMGPRTYRKGFDVLYNIHEQLRQKYPNILVLILGLFDESIKIAGKDFDISYYIENKEMLCKGNVSNPEVYYQMADVTVFPSRREGMPNVVLESMASGTPVVARKIDGITDVIIDNGLDSFLVEGDDPKDYVAHIENLIINKGLYKSMAESAIKKVQMKFSQNIIMKQYLDLYKELTAW